MFVRPGCPFCVALRSGLRRAGLPFEEVDIWRDRTAAAVVREHAGGNETVPTVKIGEVVLVNPSPRAVLAQAARAGISLDAPPSMPSREPGPRRRFPRNRGR